MNSPAGLFLNLDGHWIWLVVAAYLGGALNAVAGGGSLLVFPAMLGMGLPPIQANATNTVALWPGQLTSIAAYRSDVQRHFRLALWMALAGFLGGSSGATVLLHTPQRTFLHLIPWLLLAATLIFAASGPVSKWLAARAERRREAKQQQAPNPAINPLLFVSTVAVCFYIGYFGAGAGFLLITLLSLFGFDDLHEINALKVVSTTLANGMAFVLFVVNRQVEWRYCLLAMATCAVGGYTAARFARKVPQPVLRALVVLIGVAMTTWFFWRER
jgi:uncharacterized protein